MLVPSLVAPLTDVFVPIRTHPVMSVTGISNDLLCANIYFQVVFLLLFLHFFVLIFCSRTSAIYDMIVTICIGVLGHYM